MIMSNTNSDMGGTGSLEAESCPPGRVPSLPAAGPGRAIEANRAAGCDNLSLSSSNTKLLETQLSNNRVSNKNKTIHGKHRQKNINFNTINIATQNVCTLSCDIKLVNSIQEAKNLNIDILALQETRRPGSGHNILDTESLAGWQFIWSGLKQKAEQGVAFILAPHVQLIDEPHIHLDARIITVRVIVYGLCLALTCANEPTNEASESSKEIFYRHLRKASTELLEFKRFKSVFLGDFNATVGMNSKLSGAWDNILGHNNSSLVDTNENGEQFLKFCSTYKLKILNSIFRTKRIHRGTWLHRPTGKVKRLDYITTRSYVSKFVTSCRAYRKTSSLFDTDHFMVKMTLRYPTTKKEQTRSFFKAKPKPKLDVGSLRHDTNILKQYSNIEFEQTR